MIRINLLPQELRIKKKAPSRPIPYKTLAIGIGAIFFILTIFFYADYWKQKIQLQQLEKAWKTAGPQLTELKALEAKIEGELKNEKVFLDTRLLAELPMTWVMSWINEFLPDRAWLTELNLDREGTYQVLILQGVALPSRERTSIEQIESFLYQFQQKLPHSRLALTTSKQTKDGQELMTFSARFEWGVYEAR